MDITALEKLKILCDRDNLTYSDIAKRTNKTPQAVAQFFKSENYSIDKLKEIARACGYDVIIDFIKID